MNEHVLGVAEDEKIKISVLRAGAASGNNPETVEVDAWGTGVSGLVVHKNISSGLGWTLTHLSSGHAVWLEGKSKKALILFAQGISDIADWTLSKRELEATPGYRVKLHQALMRPEALMKSVETEKQEQALDG